MIVALDDLLARDLVRGTDVPRQFRFRHPLVRRAVYAHAGGGWRLAAHGRAAAALAARGASAAAQAHHVEHSARRGDEAAIALLRRAAASAGARAPATAARWLQAAVRLVPEEGGPETERRVELLMELADAQRASGRLEACRTDAAAGARRGRRRATAPGASRSSPTARRSSTGSGCTRRRGRGSTRRWPSSAATARRAPCCCASSGPSSTCTRSTSRAARAVAEEAHALGRELGDPLALGVSGAVLTLTAAAGGDVAAARAQLADARRGLDALRDAELADDLAALWYLGWAELYLERFDAGVAHLRRALAISRAAGRGDLIVPLLLGQARGLLALGRDRGGDRR